MTIVGTPSIRAWSMTEPDISNPSRIRTNLMPSIRSLFNQNIIVNITIMVILLSVILTMIITPDPDGLGESDRFRAEMSDTDAPQTPDRRVPFRCCVLRKDVAVCSTIQVRMYPRFRDGRHSRSPGRVQTYLTLDGSSPRSSTNLSALALLLR